MKTEKASPSWRRSPSLIVFGLVTLGLLVFAADQLRDSLHFNRLNQLAAKMESGDGVLSAAVGEYAVSVNEIVDQGYCRNDIVRAGTTLALGNVDRLAKSRDRAEWDAALDRADKILRHSIGCAPTDGNVWARLALVRWSKGAAAPEVASLLRQSAWLAPVEKNVLSVRFYLWNRVDAKTLAWAKESIDSDLRVMLSHAPAQITATTFKHVNANLLPYFNEAAGLVSPQRRDALRAAGLSL